MSAETIPTTEPDFTGCLAVAPRFHHQWMLAGNPARFLERLIADHGDFVHYRGVIDFYLVNHPVLVRQVLRETNRKFDKNSMIYNRFRNAFGNGLVTAEGERWKRQRKLMQPVFGPASIRNFHQIMLDSAEATVGRWSEMPANDHVFDMTTEMNRLTLEIAGRSFFSRAFDDSSEKISGWTSIINRYAAKPPLPLVSDLRFPSRTNLRLRKALREYRGFIRDLVRVRMEGEWKDDLLGILLTSKDEDSGEPMSEDELAEELLGMIIGGHETSSAALTWIWYELHHHPEVEERMLAEIHSVTGGGPLGFEQARELKFVNMVIQEVMRLHPPFWFENRNAISDVELGGACIPQGAMVAFSRYSLQRHPDFWQEPDKFIPERFDPDDPENPSSSCAHVPFGSGPRICIGRHFAMMELLVIVVTVLQRFHVGIDASNRDAMQARLTMTPKYGMRVNLVPRSKSSAAV